MRASVLNEFRIIIPMYTCKTTCKNCGHMTLYTEKELWRIISVANDLETELLNEGERCNICGKISPLHISVRNEDTSLLVFEKIISHMPTSGIPPLDNLPTYGASPINEILSINKDINDFCNSVNNAYNKSSMDSPCIMCCSKGTIEVQYKAHKKEDSFKGVLIEECPICGGKGYFK